MNIDVSIFQSCHLFDTIALEHYEEAISCLKLHYITAKKDQVLLESDVSSPKMGILLEGCLQVEKINSWGQRTILTQIEPGQLFGEAFTCAQCETVSVSVIAKTNSVVAWIKQDFLLQSQTQNKVQLQLVFNCLQILANKALGLTQRMEHITQPTTREKLLSYLSSQASKTHSLNFTIPFDRQQLADYLAVERSAMSTQLHQLQKEGYLICHKKKFTLLIKNKGE